MEGVHKLDGFLHCVDAAVIEERTVRRLFFLKSSEEESVWQLFSQFSAARKNGLG